MARKIFFSTLTTLLAIASHLTALEKVEMESNLKVIEHAFEVKYAPIDWKKNYNNWNLQEQIEKITRSLNADLTASQFQKTLHSFFISTADFHVQDVYYATEYSDLPFAVSEAEGRYFVTFVDPYQPIALTIPNAPPTATYLQYGDELLSFNGKPPTQVVNALAETQVGNARSKASQRVAADLLTMAFGSLGQRVHRGEVALQFKLSDGRVGETILSWRYNPEQIAAKGAKGSTIPPPYDKMMYSPLLNTLQHQKKKRATTSRSVEQKKGETSAACHREDIAFGPTIWEDRSAAPYRARIYRSPLSEKRIGYIRIDSYAPTSEIDLINSYVQHLASLLSFFETHSDALLIDQVDNSGGYALYLYAIASMLTDRPLQLPTHRRTITQEDIFNAYNTINSFENSVEIGGDLFAAEVCGYPNDAAFRSAQLAESFFLIEEWNRGATLTAPYPLFGLYDIQPSRQINYSKPIVILINSLDFSGGDFLPAILKDNKRATLFGEQTAGAGGIVETHSYPNRAGLAYYSYTASFAIRSNGVPIENIGIAPDIPYELSSDDLLYGYKSYIDAVNVVIENAIIEETSR